MEPRIHDAAAQGIVVTGAAGRCGHTYTVTAEPFNEGIINGNIQMHRVVGKTFHCDLIETGMAVCTIGSCNAAFHRTEGLQRVFALVILKNHFVDFSRRHFLEETQMAGIDTDHRCFWKVKILHQIQQSAVSTHTEDQLRIFTEFLVDTKTGLHQFISKILFDPGRVFCFIRIDKNFLIHTDAPVR